MIRIPTLSFLILFMVGCETITENNPDVQFNLNTRLDIDEKGYYHLELNRNTFQTIHRLSGNIYEDGEPKDVVKFRWTSSHYWVLGDTSSYIIVRHLTDEGVYVNVDTSYVIGMEGMEVPTINSSSYSNSDGQVNTMFSPVRIMLGDTLTIGVSYYHPHISELRTQTFQVVLD